MAFRKKLKFTALPATMRAWRGDISDFRQRLDWVFDSLIHRKSSPLFAQAVGQTLREFITQAGIVVTTALQATVSNGQALTNLVKNSANTVTDTGTVAITAGAITAINLPATSAIVKNNDAAVPLGDATAVAAGQDTGTAAVAAGVITRITLPGTDKIVKSTVKYLMPAATGTYTNGYTFTVVAGVITAVVAS